MATKRKEMNVDGSGKSIDAESMERDEEETRRRAGVEMLGDEDRDDNQGEQQIGGRDEKRD
jgi:hypothetical protein